MIAYGVITEVPAPETGHNMAAAMPLYTVTDDGIQVEALTGEVGLIMLLNLRSEVFTLGEILILDDPHGREISGKGRKPSKWGVTCETFATISEAIARAKEVKTW